MWKSKVKEPSISWYIRHRKRQRIGSRIFAFLVRILAQASPSSKNYVAAACRTRCCACYDSMLPRSVDGTAGSINDSSANTYSIACRVGESASFWCGKAHGRNGARSDAYPWRASLRLSPGCAPSAGRCCRTS